MTAINAMRFSKESGGMVTDSQGSNDIRKYDISEKVTLLDDSFIIGGSGSSSVLNDARAKLTKIYDPKNTSRQNAEALSGILNESYRSFIEQEMRNRFGFGVKEFTMGRLTDGTPIGSHLVSPAGELCDGRDTSVREYKQNAFLVIGKDASDDCYIYGVPMAMQSRLWSLPFASIGSGMDESDKVLYEFVRNIPRAGRRDIDFVKGMAALIRATNRSSDINPGVGGVPTIAYFTKDGSKILPEEDSLLATEIVKATDCKLIPAEDALQALESLLLNREDYRSIEEKIFCKKDNYSEIMRFLRGYRVQN